MIFKIKTGYNKSDFVIVDNIPDLEKVQEAYLTDAKTILSDGQFLRGKDIMSQAPNWHGEMGWHDTYEMGPEDWAQLKQSGKMAKYNGVLEAVTQYVKAAIETNQRHLIGLGNSIKLLE